jgi:hypothetical protein
MAEACTCFQSGADAFFAECDGALALGEGVPDGLAGAWAKDATENIRRTAGAKQDRLIMSVQQSNKAGWSMQVGRVAVMTIEAEQKPRPG